jgi:hypothetical protein
MSRFGTVNLLRRAATAVTASALIAGILLAAPAPAAAVTLSTAKDITALVLSNGTLRNAGDTAAATFSKSVFEYSIRTVKSSIVLSPTVSAKADWECTSDCIVTGLTAGETDDVTITVTAEDSSDQDYVFHIKALSNVATLDGIALEHSIPLSPAFNSAVTAYTASTGSTTLDVTPDTHQADATYSCKVGSAAAVANCQDLALTTVGSNSIVITVTASDGVTTGKYTVVVTRVATTNAEILSIPFDVGGLLTAASTDSVFGRVTFSSSTTEYDFTTTASALNLDAVLKNEGGSYICKVNGTTVDCNNDEILPTGSAKVLTVIVTPESAGTDKTYTFNIKKFTRTLDGGITEALTTGQTSNKIAVGKTLTSTTALTDFDGSAVAIWRQWYRCDTDVNGAINLVLGTPDVINPIPDDCTLRANMTAATYTTTAADSGKFIMVAVIGQPGSMTVFSDGVEVIGTPGLKVSTTVPTPDDVSILNASIGSEIALENVATSDFTNISSAGQISYVWYRCTSAATSASTGATVSKPTNCTVITGATDDAYTPVSTTEVQDAGFYIRAKVTLNNGASTKFAVLTRTTNLVYGPAVNTTAPAAPAAPSLTNSAPTKTITAKTGTWKGNPAVTTSSTYTYEWYMCERQVLDAADVPAETYRDKWTGETRTNCQILGGQIEATLVVNGDLCGQYLMVGVAVDNTDTRGRGSNSAMKYSASSASPVGCSF